MITTTRARRIRAGIMLGRAHWGSNIMLEQTVEDAFGRAYSRTRLRDPEIIAMTMAKLGRTPIERKQLEPHGIDVRVAGYADRVGEQQKPYRDAVGRMNAELAQLQARFNVNPFEVSLDRMEFLGSAIGYQERKIAELNLEIVNYAARLEP